VVRLIVNYEQQERLVAGGIHFSEKGILSDPLRLLLATSENYVLLSQEKANAIEVRRNLVQGVIYESSR
jgi:hypothetical protein